MAQPKKYTVKLKRTETATVTVEATSEKQAAFNAAGLVGIVTWDATPISVTDVAWLEGGEG